MVKFFFRFCPEVHRSPMDLEIINLSGVLSGWSIIIIIIIIKVGLFSLFT